MYRLFTETWNVPVVKNMYNYREHERRTWTRIMKVSSEVGIMKFVPLPATELTNVAPEVGIMQVAPKEGIMKVAPEVGIMKVAPEVGIMKVATEVGIMKGVPAIEFIKVAPEVGIMKVVLLEAVFPHIQQGAHRQVTKCKGLALEQLQPGQKLLGKSAKNNNCQIKLRSLCYVNDYQEKCLLFGPNMDARCMGLAVHCSLCELGQGL